MRIFYPPLFVLSVAGLPVHWGWMKVLASTSWTRRIGIRRRPRGLQRTATISEGELAFSATGESGPVSLGLTLGMWMLSAAIGKRRATKAGPAEVV